MLPHYLGIAGGTVSEEELDCHLILKRGWIYQEMRLSTRVLHFCAQQVVWECQTVRQSESGLFYSLLAEDYSIEDSYRSYSVDEDDSQLAWCRTAKEYSHLQLTFPEDRMPALSALIQRMEFQRGNDRFLAGLWEKTLLYDLLWHVTSFGNTTGQAGRKRQNPSWSRISTDNPVQWEPVDSILPLIEILDIQYQPIGPPHMGRFSAASIRLRAPLLRVESFITALFSGPPITPFQPPRFFDTGPRDPGLNNDDLDHMIQRVKVSFSTNEAEEVLFREFIFKERYWDDSYLREEITLHSESFFVFIGEGANYISGIHISKKITNTDSDDQAI